MKVQIQQQELRFRIDEAELAVLLAGGEVANATSFGSGSGVIQRLGVHVDASPSFETEPGEWRLLLPESDLRAHVRRLPCKDALAFELACEGGVTLTVRFDVDVRDSLQIRRPRLPVAVLDQVRGERD